MIKGATESSFKHATNKLEKAITKSPEKVQTQDKKEKNCSNCVSCLRSQINFVFFKSHSSSIKLTNLISDGYLTHPMLFHRAGLHM